MKLIVKYIFLAYVQLWWLSSIKVYIFPSHASFIWGSLSCIQVNKGNINRKVHDTLGVSKKSELADIYIYE